MNFEPVKLDFVQEQKFVQSRFDLVRKELKVISSNKIFGVLVIFLLTQALKMEKLSLSDYNKKFAS